MHPLDKWHKRNPIVWLFLYFILVFMFTLVAVILSPLEIGSDLYPPILQVLIYIGSFGIAIVIIVILISFFKKYRTKYTKNNHYRYVPTHLHIILRPIRWLTKSNQFPLIFKKIVNVIKCKYFSDKRKENSDKFHS